VVIGAGWGQRDHRNTDRGAMLPYIIRRREGEGRSDTFVTIFAGRPKAADLVRGVRRLGFVGSAPNDAVALGVDTSEGVDLVLSMVSPQTVVVDAPSGDVVVHGRAAAVLAGTGGSRAACLIGGTTLNADGVELSSPVAIYSGDVVRVGSEQGESYFEVTGDLPGAATPAGAVVFVTGDDNIQRAYPIRRTQRLNGVTRIFTKTDHTGFEARPAKRWQLPRTTAWERR